MKNIKCYLAFTLRITGYTTIGDDVDLQDEVAIPLLAQEFSAAEKEAEQQLGILRQAIESEDWEFFKKYHSSVMHGDGISLSNFRLIFGGDLEVSEMKIEAMDP